MARYKRYKVGGRTIPGMYKKQEGGKTPGDAFVSAPSSETVTDVNRDDTARNTSIAGGITSGVLSKVNPMEVNRRNLAIEKARNEAMKLEMMNQLKLQNQNLMLQNNLLKTKIEKQELIDGARTMTVTPGPKSSPKKKGGRVKGYKFPSNGIAGNSFKRGGSCLPKGRFSKKRR